MQVDFREVSTRVMITRREMDTVPRIDEMVNTGSGGFWQVHNVLYSVHSDDGISHAEVYIRKMPMEDQ